VKGFVEKRPPVPFKLLRVFQKLSEGMADEYGRRSPQDRERRGVGVDANSAVIENQDAVEHMPVDRAQFALGFVDPLLLRKPDTGVQKRSASLRQKNDRERGYHEIRTVHAGSERDEKEDAGEEKQETGGDLKPKRRLSTGVGTSGRFFEHAVRIHPA
jgi:hypothetical protein